MPYPMTMGLVVIGMFCIGLAYAAYKAPFISRVPTPIHWLLVIGLLFFVYLLGIWLEILWVRSTNQNTSLVSMAWEQRNIVLLGAIFAAAVAYICSVGSKAGSSAISSMGNRWLIIAAAALAGAISSLGMYSLWSIFYKTNFP